MRLSLLLSLAAAVLAADLLPSCPSGYTGDNCVNPICPSSSNAHPHDGKANYGDTIAIFQSQSCSGQFLFPVDNYVGELYVVITTTESGVYPIVYLYDQQNNEVREDGERFLSSNEQLTMFFMTGALRGLYSLKISNQKDTSCTIRVSTPTSLSVDGGFIQDARDDDIQQFATGDNQGIGRYPNQQQEAFLAFRVQNENFPTQAQNVHIYRDGAINQEYDVVARYNCSFPHMTKTTYTCSSLSLYHAVFVGIDNSGNLWQRVYDFACNAGDVTRPTPSGTPPTRPPIDQCYNGGVLTPNGTCYCGEFFNGDQCEWKLCMNGGTLNVRTDNCVCRTGWSGDHCQHVFCTTIADDTYKPTQRALGFVVRSAQSMLPQMSQIIQAAKNITGDASRTNYFQTYVLSVVQNGGMLFTREFDNPTAFIASLQGMIHPPVDTVCSDALLLGVASVMNTPSFQQYPNSPIFVFSDGVLNDGYATEGYALQELSKTRAQVFFLLSDAASGICNVDISSQGYQSLLGFSAFSQGLAVLTDLPHLAATATIISQSLYGSASLATNDLLDCRKAPQFQPFFVDESVKTFFVAATGTNLTLSLTLPDMTTVTPPVFFSSGNMNLWSINSPKTGAYLLSLSNGLNVANECSWRVFAPSNYSASFGASTDMLTDMYTSQPVVGKDSHLVARIENVRMNDPIDISAEITIWFNDLSSGRVVLYSSSGIWRDGCLYDLYFGSFQCTVPGMGFYVSVYLTDSRGLTILRTTTGYCSATLPPSPGEQCLNGGASFNGTCICPSHFSGDKCQITLCENQGTPQFGVCQCPPGFSGQFCEVVACIQTNPYMGGFPDYRSLTFLMHDTITTRSVLRSVNDVASRVVHDIVRQHPKWFLNYQLQRFNDTAYETISDSSDPQKFIQGITTLYNRNLNHSDYSCANLDLYATLLNALLDNSVAYGGVFYVFVYGVPRPDSDSYDKILTHVEDTRVQINVIQFSMNPCGQDYTKDGLMALTQATGGTYFLSSGPNAGNIVKSIPTQHGSGLIYERFVNNCSDTTFYVPVDANTQSFTAYIQGEMVVDPIYTNPSGQVVRTADLTNLNNVWNDIGSDSRMDQVIKACDPGWALNDGECWIFFGLPSTWQGAKGQCAANGASLATIYNKNEQQFLDTQSPGAMFWIGLNDIMNYNQWVWDTTTNQTLSLSTTRYAPWAPGQPAQDPSKRCVVDDNGKNAYGWETADCEEKHFFACVKAPYNAEFEPNDNEQNLVQRGIWSVRVQADGACSILLRAQSTLQVTPLYTTNIHSDFGVIEPLQGTNNNRLIAQVSGLAPGTKHSLEYAHVYGSDGSLIQVQTMAYRDKCSFSYFSTPFQCVGSAFQMMLTGVDSFGYSYQRVVPVICLSGPAEDSCENGGTYYNGACICPPNFFGEHCEVIACQNGGYPGGSLGACQCPYNYQGRFCELPRCTRGNGSVPDISVNGKSFVVAIDGSSTGTMASVLSGLGTTLTSVLNSVSNGNPGWFTNYVAVVFRDSASGSVPVFSSTIVSTDYTKWISQITRELKKNPYNSTLNARAIFAGLSQALSHYTVQPGSFAFVLTNSKAEDTRNEQMLLSTTARTHSSIYMLFIGDSTAPGGGNNYSDPAVADLFEAAHNSGGSAYQLSPSTKLSYAWSMILGTLYNSYTIVSHHINNCASYTDYLQLGSNETEVNVDVFQMGSPTVAVTNADGTSLKPVTLLSSKTNIISQFNQASQDPGIWGVSLKGSAGTCMYTVRGMSELQVYVGFTQDVEQDDGLHDGNAVAYPKANGLSNAVVATMSGGGQLTHAQIFDMEEHSLIWASPLRPRALCAYPYISTQVFVCDRPSFLLAIDGLDEVGHPYRRLFTFHCQGYIRPTPSTLPPVTVTSTPGPTTTPYPQCDASVRNVDIVVAFDSSFNVPEGDYVDIASKFRTFGLSLPLGKARIMMGHYDQTAQFENATLNDVVDFKTYAAQWVETALAGYTGLDGNNIDDVLQYLLTDTNVRSPFRQNVRKVVVIISSIGWDKGNFVAGNENGYTDPSTDVAALKKLGVEFIPIAYGKSANKQQLSVLSTKCLKEAHNPDDFDDIVQFIVSNLCQKTPQC